MSEVGQTIKQFIDYIYKDDTTSRLGTALYMGKLLATTKDFPVWLFKAVLTEMLLIFIIYLNCILPIQHNMLSLIFYQI